MDTTRQASEGEASQDETVLPCLQSDAHDLRAEQHNASLEVCCVCGDWSDWYNNTDSIILCSNERCQAGLDALGESTAAAVHTFCLDPPEKKIPDWDWYCPTCKENMSKPKASTANAAESKTPTVAAPKRGVTLPPAVRSQKLAKTGDAALSQQRPPKLELPSARLRKSNDAILSPPSSADRASNDTSLGIPRPAGPSQLSAGGGPLGAAGKPCEGPAARHRIQRPRHYQSVESLVQAVRRNVTPVVPAHRAAAGPSSGAGGGAASAAHPQGSAEERPLWEGSLSVGLDSGDIVLPLQAHPILAHEEQSAEAVQSLGDDSRLRASLRNDRRAREFCEDASKYSALLFSLRLHDQSHQDVMRSLVKKLREREQQSVLAVESLAGVVIILVPHGIRKFHALFLPKDMNNVSDEQRSAPRHRQVRSNDPTLKGLLKEPGSKAGRRLTWHPDVQQKERGDELYSEVGRLNRRKPPDGSQRPPPGHRSLLGQPAPSTSSRAGAPPPQDRLRSEKEPRAEDPYRPHRPKTGRPGDRSVVLGRAPGGSSAVAEAAGPEKPAGAEPAPAAPGSTAGSEGSGLRIGPRGIEANKVRYLCVWSRSDSFVEAEKPIRQHVEKLLSEVDVLEWDGRSDDKDVEAVILLLGDEAAFCGGSHGWACLQPPVSSWGELLLDPRVMLFEAEMGARFLHHSLKSDPGRMLKDPFELLREGWCVKQLFASGVLVVSDASTMCNELVRNDVQKVVHFIVQAGDTCSQRSRWSLGLTSIDMDRVSSSIRSGRIQWQQLSSSLFTTATRLCPDGFLVHIPNEPPSTPNNTSKQHQDQPCEGSSCEATTKIVVTESLMQTYRFMYRFFIIMTIKNNPSKNMPSSPTGESSSGFFWKTPSQCLSLLQKISSMGDSWGRLN